MYLYIFYFIAYAPPTKTFSTTHLARCWGLKAACIGVQNRLTGITAMAAEYNQSIQPSITSLLVSETSPYRTSVC